MTQQADIALGVGARSEKGRREDNQDKMTAFSTPLGTFYIVADGMGGHRGGAEASHSVVEGYRKHLQAFPEAADFADVLQHATALTNAEILAAGRSGDPSIAGMGSTVVMAVLRSSPAGAGAGGMEVLTAHIGDSRAYLLRGSKLTQLTHDHSAVQRMVDEQLITPEAARTHPDLNVLTRAIGKQTDVAIEVGPRIPLYPGDTVLLCTDGLWGHVPDDQIAYELSVDRTASETADVLVQMALDRGSDDNITLQILRLEDRNAAARGFPAQSVAAAVPPLGMLEMQRSRETQPAVFAPPAPAVRIDVPQARRKSRSLIYVLLLIVCIGLGVGGVLALKQFRNTKGKQGQQATPNPPVCNRDGTLGFPPCPREKNPKSTAADDGSQSGEKNSSQAQEKKQERKRNQQKDSTDGRPIN